MLSNETDAENAKKQNISWIKKSHLKNPQIEKPIPNTRKRKKKIHANHTNFKKKTQNP